MEYNNCWWEKPENKENFNLPISVINDNGVWIAGTNNETEDTLGEWVQACAQGKTKEESILNMFRLIKSSNEYLEECRLNYQRFVPFRNGLWGKTGGNWFAIFGIHVYFRYGNGMKGGKYIPFTKLNISINSDWKAYKKFMKTQK